MAQVCVFIISKNNNLTHFNETIIDQEGKEFSLDEFGVKLHKRELKVREQQLAIAEADLEQSKSIKTEPAPLQK